MRRLSLATVALCLTVAFAAGRAAENWPQWRGPGGQGISTDKQLPTEWAANENVAWKVELPHGYSSPIVWGNRIFLTSAIEGEVVPGQIPESVRIKQPHPDSVAGDRKHALKVIALDTKTGRTVWEQTAYEGGRQPKPTHFMGSPVAYGGLIAMTSEAGDTYMVKAGPTHEIVRINTIDEPVYSSAAIANGRIYIRGTKHLYAIGK